MSNMRRFKAALAAVLAALFIICAGCAVQPADAGVSASPSPAAAAPTAAAEPSPTPSATEKPAPTPTPTPEPKPQGFIDLDNCTPEQKQEADRIIQQFLNAEGKFSSGELEKAGLTDDYPLKIGQTQEFYLGMIKAVNGGDMIVEEALLLTAKIKGRFFLICGGEDKNKKRFVNPVEVPLNIILSQKDSKTSFFILTQADRLFGVQRPDGTTWDTYIAVKDEQKMIDGCNDFLGRPVCFTLRGAAIDLRYPSYGSTAFIKLINKRLSVARNFASWVYMPGYSRSQYLKMIKKFGKVSGSRPVTIKTIDGMYKASLSKTLIASGFFALQK